MKAIEITYSPKKGITKTQKFIAQLVSRDLPTITNWNASQAVKSKIEAVSPKIEWVPVIPEAPERGTSVGYTDVMGRKGYDGNPNPKIEIRGQSLPPFSGQVSFYWKDDQKVPYVYFSGMPYEGSLSKAQREKLAEWFQSALLAATTPALTEYLINEYTEAVKDYAKSYSKEEIARWQSELEKIELL